MRILLTIAILFCVLGVSRAQFGYDYLSQPTSVTSSALGGQLTSVTHGDLSSWMHNPALLDSSVADAFAFSINPYFADLFRYVATAMVPSRYAGGLAIGVVYNDYGVFERTDLSGNSLGTFEPRSYIIQTGYSHQAGPFTFGASLKYSGLLLEATKANLILSDVGMTYRSQKSQLVLGMVFRNIGWVLHETVGLERSEIPFDVVLGASFKPQYMPFRFTMTAYDIDQLGNEVVPSELQRDNQFAPFLRYVNLGGTLLIGNLIDVSIGYNYRLNETLRLDQGGFGAGWSFGTRLKFEKLQLMLSRNSYQAAGGTTFLTLQMNYRTIKNIF